MDCMHNFKSLKPLTDQNKGKQFFSSLICHHCSSIKKSLVMFKPRLKIKIGVTLKNAFNYIPFK